MWTIIKVDKKKINFFKEDLKKKIGSKFKIYNPKLITQKYKNNKLINKEFNLLGDYLFCYHEDFSNKFTINNLQFVKGLKYILNGFTQSQNEIINFINRCKDSEDKNGYLSSDFYSLENNMNYKFSSGPFANTIFKIINLQKNKIDILMGNIKTTINRKRYLISPV